YAPNDPRKSAGLLSFELEITFCPLPGDSSGLPFNDWRPDFQVRWKWQSQKFQNAFRRGAVRCDDVFVKEDQTLNSILTKIVRPAFVVRRDAVAPFVYHFEVELRYGARLRFFLSSLSPDTCLACHGP